MEDNNLFTKKNWGGRRENEVFLEDSSSLDNSQYYSNEGDNQQDVYDSPRTISNKSNNPCNN